MSTNNKRESCFELLRLLAMLFIVLEHCLMACSLNTGKNLGLIDNISWFIEAFTVCAVNVFFLLTGYLLNVAGFKLSRIIKLWFKTVFYSVSIYVILCITGTAAFDVNTFVSSIFPVTTQRYWFIQTYIVLALMIPFILGLLKQLDEKRHFFLICILLLFFSLHQTFIPVKKTLDTSQGYGIIWAFVLLTVGNFLSSYGGKYIQKIKAQYFMAGYVFVAICVFITNVLIVKFNIAQGVTSRANFYNYNSISMFVESLMFFCFFIKLSKRKFNNRYINYFASSSLAVYLIASHPKLIFSTWTDILKVDTLLIRPAMYFPTAIVLSLAVVIACILIDKILELILRKIGFGKLMSRIDESRISAIMQGK